MEEGLALLLMLMIFFYGETCSQSIKKEDYSFSIRKGSVVKGEKQNTWIIPTTLKNLSKDTLKYFSVLCSWQDFYSVDHENLFILTSLCDKNTPLVMKLAPGQSRSIDLKLLISHSIKPTLIPFKIGFNIIPADKPPSEFRIKEVLNKENVIWSNEITMTN